MRLFKKNDICFWFPAVCTLFLCLNMITGCSMGEAVIPENSQDMSVEDDISEGMSSDYDDGSQKVVIHEIAIDLTDDGVEDKLSLYLTDCEKEDPLNAEELVSDGECSVQVVVQDGAGEEILFDRIISDVHTGAGQLSLVTDGDKWYLMESSCYEQMGYADYRAEVFRWKDSEKIVADEIEIQFLISIGAAYREVLAGGTLVSREDVISDFQNFIQGWSRDAILLVAVDVMNEQNNQQGVWVSTEIKEYAPEEFYNTIWERETPTYTAGTFDELMGCSGYYIYENEYIYTTGYYYSEEGKLLAETWGSGIDGDFIVDLNGDGTSELVSNCMWYADGAMATGVYYKKDSQILYGYADDLLDEEFDNWGVLSEYSRYLPEENVVEIFYWIDEKESYDSKKYKIDLDKIEFSELTPYS